MLRVAICKSGALLSRMHRNWFAPDTGFPIEWRVSTRPSLNPPFSRLLVSFSICPAFSRSRELPPSFLPYFIYFLPNASVRMIRKTVKEWTIVWSMCGATCNVAVQRSIELSIVVSIISAMIEIREKEMERERTKVWQVRLFTRLMWKSFAKIKEMIGSDGLGFKNRLAWRYIKRYIWRIKWNLWKSL